MEEVVKIYDSSGFYKILQGLQVIQTSKIENIEAEISPTVPILEIIDPNALETLTCSFCNISFDDNVLQRQHYKTDWHRYNLKQDLKVLDPVSEEYFDQLADDVSSISGSDTEKEDVSESTDIESSNYAVNQGKIFFQNGEGKVFSLYRCLLHEKKETPSDEAMLSFVRKCGINLKWTIFMLGGGHFAGAVFDGSEVLVHKTFHCYTVRAKQGGSQGSRDNKSGGSHPKSAGASLRRYNEQSLVQHVGDILQTWSTYIENSHLIFYRAAGPYNRSVLFGGKVPVLKKNDNRLRTIPFSTRRPTYTELLRVYDVLCNVEVYSSLDDIKNLFIKQKEEQLNNSHGSRRESPKNKNINRAKSRESKERPLPGQDESSSESDENKEDYVLIAEDDEISFNDLQQYADTVPEAVKKGKAMKKRRPKKKDKVKEITENVKKQLYSACSKGILESLQQIIKSVRENKYNENGEDEVLKVLNSVIDEHGNTPLHIAAISGHGDMITWLMENEATPCNKNDKNQTPYTVNADKTLRNVFRTFAINYPDKYNYAKSHIPVIVSTVTEEELAEKRKAVRKVKREREKEKRKENEIKKKETEERDRFVNLSDREKRALAAERRILLQSSVVLVRCFLCGEDISGKVPFEYSNNRFCSINCLKAHRIKNVNVLS